MGRAARLSERREATDEEIHELLVQELNQLHSIYHSLGGVLVKVNPAPGFVSDGYERSLYNSLRKFHAPSHLDRLPPAHIFKLAADVRRKACQSAISILSEQATEAAAQENSSLGWRSFDASDPYAMAATRPKSNGSQYVILRGSHGSGKSEAIKAFLQYIIFADTWDQSGPRTEDPCYRRDLTRSLGTKMNPFIIYPDTTQITKRLLAGILISEVFSSIYCEDKIINSSRCMKHYHLHMNSDGYLTKFRIELISGGLMKLNVRDKSIGITMIQAMVANGIGKQIDSYGFHANLRELYPQSSTSYNLQMEYEHLRSIVLQCGIITEELWGNMMNIVAACVYLQAVTILGVDASIISTGTKSYVTSAENILGLPNGTLINVIMKRPDERIGRPSGATIDCKPLESRAIIDSLICDLLNQACRILLNELSSDEVPSIIQNSSTTTTTSDDERGVIHLIDPVGWERTNDTSPGNLFQLLNNFTEEKITESFISRIFREEFARYEAEGVVLAPVPLPNWQPSFDLFEKPPTGLLLQLDEICQQSRGDDKTLADRLIYAHAKGSKLIRNGGVKSKPTFITISHSGGDISYDTEGFLLTNRSASLGIMCVTALRQSKYPWMSLLEFDDLIVNETVTQKTTVRSKLTMSSYASIRTRENIRDVIKSISTASQVHYIACLSLTPLTISSDTTSQSFVKTQIESLCLSALVQLADRGFPYSRNFHTFLCSFRFLAPFSHPTLPIILPSEPTNKEELIALKSLVRNLVYELAKLPVVIDAMNTLLPGKTMEDIVHLGHGSVFAKEGFGETIETYAHQERQRQNRAIIRIQSIVRMSQWRKKYLLQRYAAIIIETKYRSWSRYTWYQRYHSAAIRVKFFLYSAHIRRKFLQLKWAVKIVQERLLGKMLQRVRYLRLQRAAKAFQCMARGFIVSQASRNVYNAVILLQRKCRFFVRKIRKERNEFEATRHIQRIWRGYWIRCIYRHLVQVLKIRREQRIAERVVRRLQSLWRGKLVTARFREVHDVTIQLQRWFRTRLDRWRFLRIKKAVIWIQSHVRRQQAARYANDLKVEAMVRQQRDELLTQFITEIDFIGMKSWNDVSLGGGLLQEKWRFSRLLLAYDVSFSLEFAYPDGWLEPITNFITDLRENERREIVWIGIGHQHTVLVDDSSNVYTMGFSDFGQLGHNNRVSLSTPKCIEQLPSILAATQSAGSKAGVKYTPTATMAIGGVKSLVTVKSVACGRDHTLLLTSTSRVLSWGDNRRGQLGQGHWESSAIPRLVLQPDNSPLSLITSISCGDFHCAALSECGALYTWGASYGLGRPSAVERETIQSQRAGADSNAFFLAQKRTVISQKNVTQPPQYDSSHADIVPFFKVSRRKISAFVCGTVHTTVLCGGQLYSFGQNHHGQLGTGNLRTYLLPTPVDFQHVLSPSDILSAQLLCGGRHLVLIVRGSIWSWGNNRSGQVGTGNFDDVLSPTRIILPSGVDVSQTALSLTTSLVLSTTNVSSGANISTKTAVPSKTVLSAVVGWRHTVVQTSSHVFAWGVLNPIALGTADGLRDDVDEDGVPPEDDYANSNLHGKKGSSLPYVPFETYPQPTLVPFSQSQTVNLHQRVIGLSGDSSSSLSYVALHVRQDHNAPTFVRASATTKVNTVTSAEESARWYGSLRSSAPSPPPRKNGSKLEETADIRKDAYSHVYNPHTAKPINPLGMNGSEFTAEYQRKVKDTLGRINYVGGTSRDKSIEVEDPATEDDPDNDIPYVDQGPSRTPGIQLTYRRSVTQTDSPLRSYQKPSTASASNKSSNKDKPNLKMTLKADNLVDFFAPRNVTSIKQRRLERQQMAGAFDYSDNLDDDVGGTLGNLLAAAKLRQETNMKTDVSSPTANNTAPRRFGDLTQAGDRQFLQSFINQRSLTQTSPPPNATPSGTVASTGTNQSRSSPVRTILKDHYPYGHSPRATLVADLAFPTTSVGSVSFLSTNEESPNLSAPSAISNATTTPVSIRRSIPNNRSVLPRNSLSPSSTRPRANSRSPTSIRRNSKSATTSNGFFAQMESIGLIRSPTNNTSSGSRNLPARGMFSTRGSMNEFNDPIETLRRNLKR